MSDPLVRLLKRVRDNHRISQARVEICMGLPPDTYRHIERGRRPLPDIQRGLVPWIEKFLDCVDATPAERKEVVAVIARSVLDQLERLVDDP